MPLTPFQKATFRQHTHLASQIKDENGDDAIQTGGGTAAIDAAIAAHVAASDPHPVYLTQAEADALYANRGVLGFAAQTADQAVGVSSGAFSAVTGLGFNVTTRAERIKVSFTAVATLASGGAIGVDVTIDGTRVGTGVWGLSLTDISATEGVLTFTVISPVLTAGVHAIALVARGKPSAGGTILGSAGTGVGNMLVVEATGLAS